MSEDTVRACQALFLPPGVRAKGPGLAHDNFDGARMFAQRVGFGPITSQVPGFFTREHGHLSLL